MPLNILDMDDIESRSGAKLDRWLKEFAENFLRPVVDAEISRRLQMMVGPIDPLAAQKIHSAMGGSDDGES